MTGADWLRLSFIVGLAAGLIAHPEAAGPLLAVSLAYLAITLLLEALGKGADRITDWLAGRSRPRTRPSRPPISRWKVGLIVAWIVLYFSALVAVVLIAG